MACAQYAVGQIEVISHATEIRRLDNADKSSKLVTRHPNSQPALKDSDRWRSVPILG